LDESVKILVTGAAGFIGSSLVDKLLGDDSCEVVGVDSFNEYYDPAIKRRNLRDALSSSRFQLVEGDITRLDLKDVLQGVNVVYHLAAQPGVRSSWGAEFATYANQNILASQLLLEACTELAHLDKFVYASSSSVYGNAERFPTHESDLPAPMSPYGVSKLAAEHLVSLYARNFGLPTVSLRFFTVYGPRQRPDMAFHRFIRHALDGDAITVYGDGRQEREFTHVSDIVDALRLARDKDVTGGMVINLSGGNPISVNQAIETVESLLGRTVPVHRTAPVAGDVVRTGGSTALAQQYLGWNPSVTIEEGLRSEIDWLLAEGN
jgi:UDP-glucuronate 4-epimerase